MKTVCKYKNITHKTCKVAEYFCIIIITTMCLRLFYKHISKNRPTVIRKYQVEKVMVLFLVLLRLVIVGNRLVIIGLSFRLSRCLTNVPVCLCSQIHCPWSEPKKLLQYKHLLLEGKKICTCKPQPK